MTTLKQYQADITVNNETGESFTSMRGLSRICGVSSSTIHQWASVRQYGILEAEILTAQGLRSVRQFKEDEIAEAISKYNPTLAKQLIKLGVRKMLHQMAGYEESAKPTLSYEQVLDVALESLRRERALYKSNMPGLIEHFKQVTDEKALAPGKRTLKQIVDGYGATVELGMLSSLGRHVASVYRDLWHEEPETTWEDGRNVAAYPYTIDKCVETWLRGRGYIN